MANFTLLANFSSKNGSNPHGGLLLDANGDVFGTTQQGANGLGTVFELSDSGGSYALATVASFTGLAGANMGPYAGLVADAAGDLFGTTQQGGAYGLGSVFEIVRTASGYAASPVTLISFDHQNGAWPESDLVIDPAGDLFGTTLRGAAGNGGVVFEVAKTASGYASAITTLDSFSGPNGADPQAGLLADAAGNLFGTTLYGGAYGGGSVFELVRSGTAYTPTTLASFTGGNGLMPGADLIADAAGNLFGTTQQGGAYGSGDVFEILKTTAGYAATPVVLASFNGSDGSQPGGALLMDAAGDLFGTTSAGGSRRVWARRSRSRRSAAATPRPRRR